MLMQLLQASVMQNAVFAHAYKILSQQLVTDYAQGQSSEILRGDMKGQLNKA
jgi:hypothetical protein